MIPSQRDQPILLGGVQDGNGSTHWWALCVVCRKPVTYVLRASLTPDSWQGRRMPVACSVSCALEAAKAEAE